jgi:malate dehydrogenase
MKKITIVGAGHVGETTAQILASNELCQELVLIDIEAEITQGVALDIQESAPALGFDTRITGAADPEAMAGSELVIVSAGLPRKPGMSRDDLLDANLPIIRSIVDHVTRYAPEALLLIVSNPVDVLTYHAWRHSGWERNRVFGLSGVLDSTRMASFVSLETGFSVKDISALVLGGHGDAMVPLPRYTCINGIPIEQFLDKGTIARLVERTRNGGAEILKLRETGSAYDAPAAAILTMVDAVARNRRRILPCVAILGGEYGESDIAMGVPAVLAGSGVQQVIELPLSEGEQAALRDSAAKLRVTMDKAEIRAQGAVA